MAASISPRAFHRAVMDPPRAGFASLSAFIAGFWKRPDPHRRELFLNHLWESLNAGAKILFFAVVTPLMLSAWGIEQFGLFAVANSCVALMAFLDLGLRTLTRLGLTNPRYSEAEKIRLHALNVAAFSAGAAAAVAITGLLAANGCWHRWLRLPSNGDAVIAATVALTAALMWLQLLVERIAASGKLSRIKAALFVGNLLAFILVVTLLKHSATVATITTAYFATLAAPLIFLLPFAHLQPRSFAHALVRLRVREILSAIRSGGWINLITASWIFQSYGLVLLVSWMLGPAAAGVFFLYLKLSELLSVLGASASEPTVAALASAATAQDRHRHFAVSYKSAIALCLGGATGYTFFCDDLFRVWLHRPLGNSHVGLLIGLFGVAGGFSRMVVAASLGLARPRPVALGLLAWAVVVVTSIVGLRAIASPQLILAISCASALLVIPSAATVARDLGSTFARTWFQPLANFAPSLVAIIFVCWLTTSLHNGFAFAATVAASSLICLRYLFGSSNESRQDSLLGYDTRSWRSALVMRAVDIINPFQRAEKFQWTGPCVVSSTAGLGDLFIHLPLIAGIIKESQRRGLITRVALRPVHAAIGEACGWNVLPFDPALEDFFKNPFAIRPANLFRQVRQTRRIKSNLWIDLAGSAVSALSIKLAGVRQIASRITRGGRSLVNHPLPHTLHENEYGNVARVAEFLRCEPDYAVFDRLRGDPLPDLQDTVVLCLTTVCRWRNWPLSNFLALVDRFPDVRFVATGLSAEVVPEEQSVFAEILQRPNVISRVDKMSIPDLIRLIAHARGVITNDTSTAHIANAYHRPGAVLFGPASPDKLAAPYGLKSFADRTCPFHPCVQWTCQNQENWCMRKLEAGPVGDHLAAVLATTAPYAATASALAWEPSPIGISSAVH